jgi:hypothetical protein
MGPDGAVVKGSNAGDLGDKKTSMGGGNLLVCQVLSPLSLPPFKRWAPGSGPLGCLAGLSGPLGPLAPVVPVLGIHGRPLYFPDLPRPWSLLIWVPTTALTPRERTWIDLGQVGFRIRHA